MPTKESRSESLEERANRLYWESDRSVNQIADDLEMSKGSLYEVVHPLPSDVSCPGCGGVMGYANRTARERGFLTCSECGLEEEVGQLSGGVGAEGGPQGAGAPVVSPRALRKARERGWDPLTRVVAGTALLGIAAGITLATILRKR